MLKLIRLEMRKIKLGGLLIAALIANVILIFWCVINTGGHPEGYDNYTVAFAEIGFYVNMTFGIFSSILISRTIIDEYRNKTISVMFTYPIPRQKLFIAKLIFISVSTLITVIISNVIVTSVFILYDSFQHSTPGVLTANMLLEVAGRTIIFALVAVGSSYISLFFGMIRKSVPATIIPSFIISLVSSDFYITDSIKILVLSLGWIVIGVIMVYLSIRYLGLEDIN